MGYPVLLKKGRRLETRKGGAVEEGGGGGGGSVVYVFGGSVLQLK